MGTVVIEKVDPLKDPRLMQTDQWLPGAIEETCKQASPGSDLEALFRSEVFKKLDMASWVSSMLEMIDHGEITTFGAIARGLGDPAAARAVGALISEGAVDGPVHRVVFSDGRIPDGSGDMLSHELGIENGASNSSRSGGPVEFELSRPPLKVLSRLQGSLARRMVGDDRPVTAVCGLDVSYGADDICALCRYSLSGTPEGEMTIEVEPGLPYIPGYLFYREGPCMMDAVSKALNEGMIDGNTLVMVDGNGTLHPRRMGIACQLGMVMDIPTCGVSKRLMFGRVGDHRMAFENFSVADVRDGDDVIGASIWVGGSRPFYLSSGYHTDLEGCISITSRMLKGRYPAPVKRAHVLANEVRKLSIRNPTGRS